jgi:hypothetical protein
VASGSSGSGRSAYSGPGVFFTAVAAVAASLQLWQLSLLSRLLLRQLVPPGHSLYFSALLVSNSCPISVLSCLISALLVSLSAR